MLPGAAVLSAYAAVWAAQAEPAPEPAAPSRPEAASPPAPSSAAAPGATQIGMAGGVGVRLGAGADDVPPDVGYALRPLVRHTYGRLGSLPLELGIEGAFALERYQSDVQVGAELSTRSVSYYDFSALQAVAAPIGPVRPWLGAGAGLAMAHFRSFEREYAPGEQRATRPLLRGAAGVDVDVTPRVAIGARVDYSYLAGKPTLSTTGRGEVRPFGDRTSAQMCISYRF